LAHKPDGDDQTVYQRADDVEEIPYDGRLALYGGDMEKVVILNATGAILWKQLETPRNQGVLVRHLQTQFPEVALGQLEGDVSAFLHELVHKKCIKQYTRQ
jgi:hypothetical protein